MAQAIVCKLKVLKKMMDEDLITAEEFQERKHVLLDRWMAWKTEHEA